MRSVSSEQALASERRLLPAGVKVSWPNFIPIVGIHGLALLALDPRFYSTTGVCLLVVFSYVVAPLGINLCYHRMLAHRGLAVPKWLERVLVVFAVCCLEGPPGQWVATHRAHHKHADRERDPHSPHQSFFWAHVGWLLFAAPDPPPTTLYARDILKDKFYRWLQSNFVWAWLFLAHVVLIFSAGFVFSLATGATTSHSATFGFGLVIWGVVLRAVLVWHVTWSVNSLTHWAGYRNYQVRDDSRNNPWVGLLATGEGWHNNHHADPASCCNQHRWWEFDLTWVYICVLRWCGLAHDVVMPRFQRQARARRAAAKVELRERDAHK